MSDRNELEALQDQVALMAKFPDQNPNPVLKISSSGELLYSNEHAATILQRWQQDVGTHLHPELASCAGDTVATTVELRVGNSTYAFHVAPVPEFGFVNIYGTDVTAVRAIAKFPDQNPNPVLKTDLAGNLLYANPAGASIVSAWEIRAGDLVPSELLDRESDATSHYAELPAGTRIFAFHVVTVPEFECLNIYGTDITASKDNEQILAKLAKYFSRQVYDSIFAGNLEVKIQTERKRLTVFFSDIRGFSEITERLEPEVLTELITEYLSAMTDIAVKHGGTVDKYIGDAIMIFFGDPHTRGPREDALACVRMAMEMKDAARTVRALWRDRGLAAPLDIRIGIHTDICTVGNFGSRDRLDYTTIGNGVNLASRLESNARLNQILISEDTYLLIRDVIRCQKLDKIEVKNMKHPVQTYEVDAEATEPSALRSIEREMDGFSLFVDAEETGDIAEKREALQRALKLIDRLD